MSEKRIAGRFQLKSAKLIPYNRDPEKIVDIKDIILGFTISESMSRAHVHGFTTVFDSTNIMNDFPLRGEEYIEFEYEDFYGNNRKDFFFVYAISDISYPDPVNPAMLRFTLNFVSVPKVFSESFRILKAYTNRASGSGLVSDYVEEVFIEYYRSPQEDRGIPTEYIKDIEIEETAGTQNLVVPNYTPEETMLFFSRKAYSAESTTQTFRFFENRDKFYFCTNELMELEAANNFIQYYYTYGISQNPEDQETIQQTLSEVNFGSKVNTINDIVEGAYEKTIYEIDLMNGTLVQMPQFNFLDVFYGENQELAHTRQFVNENIDDKYRRFVLKDWASDGAPNGPEIRNNTYFADLYSYKNTFFYHYNQNTIGVSAYGRNDIVAGSVVLLDMLERRINSDGNPGLDRDMQRSGLYFVESIDNIFYENTYIQNMKLARYGVGIAGGGGELPPELETGNAITIIGQDDTQTAQDIEDAVQDLNRGVQRGF